MQLKINGQKFTCLDVQLPGDDSITRINEDTTKVALYYTANLNQSDNPEVFRIYNKQKLNQYRINRTFDGIQAEITDEVLASYKEEALLTGKCNIVLPNGDNLPPMNFNVIYDSDSMKAVPFLPNIYTQDDEYVVYSLENYFTPQILDLFSPTQQIELKLNHHKSLRSEIYEKIMKDIVCFNVDATQYIRGKKPYFYNLGWMSIYDISIGRSDGGGYDSHIIINDNRLSWKYVAIHELWPINQINKESKYDLELDGTLQGDALKEKIYHQHAITFPEISEKEIENNIIYKRFL